MCLCCGINCYVRLTWSFVTSPFFLSSVWSFLGAECFGLGQWEKRTGCVCVGVCVCVCVCVCVWQDWVHPTQKHFCSKAWVVLIKCGVGADLLPPTFHPTSPPPSSLNALCGQDSEAQGAAVQI